MFYSKTKKTQHQVQWWSFFTVTFTHWTRHGRPFVWGGGFGGENLVNPLHVFRHALCVTSPEIRTERAGERKILRRSVHLLCVHSQLTFQRRVVVAAAFQARKIAWRLGAICVWRGRNTVFQVRNFHSVRFSSCTVYFNMHHLRLQINICVSWGPKIVQFLANCAKWPFSLKSIFNQWYLRIRIKILNFFECNLMK